MKKSKKKKIILYSIIIFIYAFCIFFDLFIKSYIPSIVVIAVSLYPFILLIKIYKDEDEKNEN